MKRNKPKTLTGLSQKAEQWAASLGAGGTRTSKTAGEETGTNAFVLLERNTVNPTTRLVEAGVAAKRADELAGRGCWKKVFLAIFNLFIILNDKNKRNKYSI